jgi:hypothetical protein
MQKKTSSKGEGWKRMQRERKRENAGERNLKRKTALFYLAVPVVLLFGDGRFVIVSHAEKLSVQGSIIHRTKEAKKEGREEGKRARRGVPAQMSKAEKC